MSKTKLTDHQTLSEEYAVCFDLEHNDRITMGNLKARF